VFLENFANPRHVQVNKLHQLQQVLGNLVEFIGKSLNSVSSIDGGVGVGGGLSVDDDIGRRLDRNQSLLHQEFL
jgi:hypothetical protein